MTDFQTLEILYKIFKSYEKLEFDTKPFRISAKFRQIFAYKISKRVKQYDRNTLIFLALYTIFKHEPKSFSGFLKYANEISAKEISHFKLDFQKALKTYKLEVKKLDLENYDLNDLFHLYFTKEINFITLYYKIKNLNFESILYEITFRKIKFLMLFVEKILKK